MKQSALAMLNDNNVPPSNTMPPTVDDVPLFIGKLSPLLTAWRKLWVERDTMNAPGIGGITVVGTVDAITPNVPAAGQSTIDLGQNLDDDFSDENLYEEGRIVFTNCPAGQDTFPVIESTSNVVADDEIIVLGVPGPCATGSGYTLYDDDDPTVLPHYPDGGQLLIDAFSVAYILPQYAGSQFQDIVSFEMHLSDWSIEFGGTWSSGRDLSSSAQFWACLIVGCWEPKEDVDRDPDFCFSLFPPFAPTSGAELGEFGVTDGPAGRSAIYLQTLADQNTCLSTTDEEHTVAHEIGHTCGSHGHHVSYNRKSLMAS
jgi:hypothetical protein